MAAIQITSSDKKQVKRTVTSFDQRLAYSQGYFLRITNTTPVTIANVISAAGVIALPQVYSVGREALRVHVDGILLPQPGVDYTEDNTLQITLAAGHVSVLNPATSVIFIEWNRFVPGVRDQSFEDLTDIIPDLSAGVRDTGTLRASPATAANPLTTFADLPSVPAATTLLASYGDSQFNHAGGTYQLFGGSVVVPASTKFITLQGAIAGPAVTGMDLADFNIDIDVVGSTMTGYALYHDGTAAGMGAANYNAASIAAPPVTVVPSFGEDAGAAKVAIVQWTGAGGLIRVDHVKGAGGASSIAASLRLFG
jgi:hypothetical protein